MEASSISSGKESCSLPGHADHGSTPQTSTVDVMNTEQDLRDYWDSLDVDHMIWNFHILRDDNGKIRVIALQDVCKGAQDTQEPIILINVEALAEKAFTTVGSSNKAISLKLILESNKHHKYSFLWRTFAACLHNEYGVTLRANKSIQIFHNAVAIARRQENTVEVPVLKDLEHCISDYINGDVDPAYLFVGTTVVELHFLRDSMKSPMPSCSKEIDDRTAAVCCANINLMSKLHYLINASLPCDNDQIDLRVLRASTEDVQNIPPAENDEGTFATSPFTLDCFDRIAEKPSDNGGEAREAEDGRTDLQDNAESNTESKVESNLETKIETNNIETNNAELKIQSSNAGKKKKKRTRRSKRKQNAQTGTAQANFNQNGNYHSGTYQNGNYQISNHQNSNYQIGNYQNGNCQNDNHQYQGGGWQFPTPNLPPPAYYGRFTSRTG